MTDFKTTIVVRRPHNTRPHIMIEWDGPLTPAQIDAFGAGPMTPIVEAAHNLMKRGVCQPDSKGRCEFRPGTKYYVYDQTDDSDLDVDIARAAIERAEAV